MNLDRNGKIAQLPKHVREELNRRLDNGERGQPLLQWLNSQPEVRALVAAEFDGWPLSKHNLSRWRRGGYTEWKRQQETRDLAQQMITEAGEFQPAGAPPLTDRMAVWVTARYLLSVRRLTEQAGAEASDLPAVAGILPRLGGAPPRRPLRGAFKNRAGPGVAAERGGDKASGRPSARGTSETQQDPGRKPADAGDSRVPCRGWPWGWRAAHRLLWREGKNRGFPYATTPNSLTTFRHRTN